METNTQGTKRAAEDELEAPGQKYRRAEPSQPVVEDAPESSQPVEDAPALAQPVEEAAPEPSQAVKEGVPEPSQPVDEAAPEPSQPVEDAPTLAQPVEAAAEKVISISEDRDVYVVTFTEFTDDYKSRGDDWADVSEPVVFSSYDKADEYVDKILLERVVEFLEDNEGDAEYDKYWRRRDEESLSAELDDMVEEEAKPPKQMESCDKKDTSKESDDEKVLSLSQVKLDLDKLVNIIQEAEFVNQKFDWDITCCTIDEKASK